MSEQMHPEQVVFLVNSRTLRGWLEPALAANGIPYIWSIQRRIQAVRTGASADAWRRRVVVVPLSLHALSPACDFFRECAPGADIRIFFAPAAPWLDAEAYCATMLTVGYPRHLQALLVESIRNSSVNICLDRLYADFGRERVSVFKGWEEPCTPAALLHTFFTGTGLGSAAEAATLAASLCPSAPRPTPRLDVLRFMEAINFLFTHEVTPDTFTWRGQRALLQGGTGDERIMPPSQRALLLKRLLAEERDAPQHLEIIPFLEQEARMAAERRDEPENCDDLCPENARRLAELLDPDFARWILDAPHKPEESRRVVSRVCLEAIGQVHGKVSAKPPKTPPKVSVLTLTYNHGKYIEETIKSVLMQETSFELEHIILDNGSSDETTAIIRDYASTHKSIRPIIPGYREPHAVLWLFEAARAPYVALCEGDDYFTDPAKLQTQVDFLEEYKNSALCFHPVRVLYEGEPDRERIYPPVEELPRGPRQFYYAGDLARVNFIQTNSVMYRWRFQNGLPVWFHPELTQGDWYWHMLHAETGKIGFINKIMSVYRRHADAQWYLSEINRQEHRYKVGLHELHGYHVMNEHHNGIYNEHFLRLGDGVIADILLHAKKVGDSGIIDEINDKYPAFAKHFTQSLAAMKKRGENGAGRR